MSDELPDEGKKGSGPIQEPAAVHRMELLVSYLLRGGVIVSIVLVFLGTCLTYVHHPDYATATRPVHDVPAVAKDFPHTVGETLTALSEGRGQGFILLGLLVLLLTPVLRVAASIGAFAWQRDWRFVVVTTVVLVILIVSFFLGKTEG